MVEEAMTEELVVETVEASRIKYIKALNTKCELT